MVLQPPRCNKLKTNQDGYPESDKLLVTCGLPYVNGPMHIAHLRTYFPADIYVRYQRKLGRDVVFISGSDTHGTPITVKAEELGTKPERIVEQYHNHFRQIFPRLGVFFDNYGSTDSPSNHHRTRDIAMKLLENGHIYPKDVTLPYCPSCERFLPDRYLVGTCAHCGAEARGDECDQGCGRYLEPGEITNPRRTICGTTAELKETRHYFLKLTDFEEYLRGFLENVGGTENARNYAKGWIEGGLKDWNITRNIKWGIPFPGTDDLVLYVWFDAPIGYISSTEDWAERTGGDWEHYWKGDGRLIHFIGGDIVYHHCLFWPSMLKGSGYSAPDAVVASGMVRVAGHNFSKSRGFVLWVEDDYLEEGLDPDSLRYYIASYTGHTRDLDFSWETYFEKLNKELVGIIGNFVYRSILFAYRNYGRIPKGYLEPEIEKAVRKAKEDITGYVQNYEFKKICDTILGLAITGNKYLQEKEPWKLKDTDPEDAKDVIHTAVWLCKAIAVLGEPVFPFHAYSVFRQLGLDYNGYGLEQAMENLNVGYTLEEPRPLFTPLTEDDLASLKEALTRRIEKASG